MGDENRGGVAEPRRLYHLVRRRRTTTTRSSSLPPEAVALPPRLARGQTFTLLRARGRQQLLDESAAPPGRSAAPGRSPKTRTRRPRNGWRHTGIELEPPLCKAPRPDTQRAWARQREVTMRHRLLL